MLSAFVQGFAQALAIKLGKVCRIRAVFDVLGGGFDEWCPEDRGGVNEAQRGAAKFGAFFHYTGTVFSEALYKAEEIGERAAFERHANSGGNRIRIPVLQALISRQETHNAGN
jgi:hypothetical protein